MRDSKNLKGLQDTVTTVFDNIETFVKNHEDIGYLSTNNRTEDSLDVIVGVERFTIHNQIWMSESRIIFKVYSWEFDLSSISRYKAKYVEELNFMKDGNTIMFIKPRHDDKNREIQVLCQIDKPDSIYMVERLLNQFEAYTDKRLESLNDLFKSNKAY